MVSVYEVPGVFSAVVDIGVNAPAAVKVLKEHGINTLTVKAASKLTTRPVLRFVREALYIKL